MSTTEPQPTPNSDSPTSAHPANERSGTDQETTDQETTGQQTTGQEITGQASPDDALMQTIDEQVAHIWMVRTFLKHSEEAEEDDELASVHRDLYDFMLALGPALDAGDSASYLKLAKKKLRKLQRATELYTEIQPEISGHMNFKMANQSLQLAVAEITKRLGK